MADVPHFALPFSFQKGRAVVNEQDSVEDVAACVEALLRTPAGFRDDAPDFGIEDQAFQQNGVDLDDLAAAIEAGEPRARADLTAGEILNLAQRVGVRVGIESA